MSFSQSKSDQYKKYEFKKLCFLLGFNKSKITKLLDSIDASYSEWTESKQNNDGEPKAYWDGTIKTRTFRIPSQLLKEVQIRIKNNILDKIPLPDCVHGGVKGRSNITNAKKHQGNKYIFVTDLQEFYPNISMRRVFQLFSNLGYSPHISHWLTLLTTRKNELPQGSPASTSIANLIFLEADTELMKICKESNITYTRYIDDLTFSSQSDFGGLVDDILQIVIKNNFKISRRKTKYEGKQSVTGIEVFLNKIDAPKHIIEKSIVEMSSNSEKKPYTNYLKNIRKTNWKRKNIR
ncbi:reverse transcriptase family protein [Pseudoflavitalea rhizosphaerae]|uniref:reverse transcriptase family protein n=1 Tax=Pseudoflavitalea rhizosphaerae TaxID=1884793 RepID=UPI000F8F4E88|nr:reverse transcriptase family protein [Pseudoflavitalea rhizosphaerae]